MSVHYTDDHLTIHAGDVREVLPTLPAESVHCVVTSPPYWGLRDYGTAGQLGLEPTPEEYVANLVGIFREVRRVLRADGTVWLNLGSSYMPSGQRQTGRNDNGRPEKGRGWAEYDITRTALPAAAGASGRSRSRQPERAPAYGTDGTAPQGSPGPGSAYPDLCDGCRAALSSRTTGTLQPLPADASPLSPTGRDSEPAGFGLDAPAASPLAAPASTTPRSETPPSGPCSHCGNCGVCLAVMRSPSRDARECARMSAYSDGTGSPSEPSAARNSGTEPSGLAWGDYTSTIKPKDMVPIPWMVAMALQADGWYLRSDIVWAKPNPMPESVTDRPTKAHEYLFLLSKAPRYYYDADAVREGFADGRMGNPGRYRATYANDPRAGGKMSGRTTGEWNTDGSAAGRNLRSVWTVATQPYPGAHFATFPEKLVEPCVKAGTSERGVCPECGARWVRMVSERPYPADLANARKAHGGIGNNLGGQRHQDWLDANPKQTTGWRPSCAHDAEPVPATVLDPFGGSGTTARVANRLGRRAILVELNPDYIDQALTRNAQAPLGLGA